MWIGQQNSRTNFHQDYGWTSPINFQIYGRKEWYLISPEAELFTSHLDEGDVDFESFKGKYAKNCYKVILEPGELIFVPTHWWHSTRLVTHSISMSVNIVDKRYYSNYLHSLLHDFLAMIIQKKSLIKQMPHQYELKMRRFKAMAKIMNLDSMKLLKKFGQIENE